MFTTSFGFLLTSLTILVS
ncbi:hypothetical protein E2C01_062257 [Portunus trituberculatus]|uniref:Uncharacterized protein n=1 Tax=Portunus trituberculatus TaxID=210409 RepID=A0A5B7HFM0_PORTR|nr:hypothetical protein [Portunus trituberculatus]